MSTLRTALITGGASGIGLATARRMCASGYQVLIVGRDAARGRQAAESLGRNCRFVSRDVSSEGAAGMLIEAAITAFGRLDVVVNNAAVDLTGDLLETPMSEVRATFETNTFAVISMLQAAGRAMRASGNGGAIINVTSRLATIGVPMMGLYGASKGAIRTLTTAAAVELAVDNIRVNAVAPGMTRTPLLEEWLATFADPVAKEAEVARSIPMGRLASAEDVSAAICFLASEEAAYLTGVTIAVDGGYTAQ